MTQRELIEMILWKADRKKKTQKPYSDRLNELYGVLCKYTYAEHELKMLKLEIWAALPKWRQKQIAKEQA